MALCFSAASSSSRACTVCRIFVTGKSGDSDARCKPSTSIIRMYKSIVCVKNKWSGRPGCLTSSRCHVPHDTWRTYGEKVPTLNLLKIQHLTAKLLNRANNLLQQYSIACNGKTGRGSSHLEVQDLVLLGREILVCFSRHPGHHIMSTFDYSYHDNGLQTPDSRQMSLTYPKIFVREVVGSVQIQRFCCCCCCCCCCARVLCVQQQRSNSP